MGNSGQLGGALAHYQRTTQALVHESQIRGHANLFSRSMVGSAGTRQPAESRSQACRRACPAHDAGVHAGGGVSYAPDPSGNLAWPSRGNVAWVNECERRETPRW